MASFSALTLVAPIFHIKNPIPEDTIPRKSKAYKLLWVKIIDLDDPKKYKIEVIKVAPKNN